VIYLQNAKLSDSPNINGNSEPGCFIIRSTNKDFILKASNSANKQKWCHSIRKLLPELVAPYRVVHKSGSFKLPESLEKYLPNAILSQVGEDEEGSEISADCSTMRTTITEITEQYIEIEL